MRIYLEIVAFEPQKRFRKEISMSFVLKFIQPKGQGRRRNSLKGLRTCLVL